MIPKLHDKTGTVIGELTDCLKGITIEERNGMLEAEITYQLFSPHWDKLIRGNIFTADVNDKIKNQQFRIYKVGKTIKGVFNVYARHISYDAQRDMIEGLDIQNQSCEYCLNMIFRNSQFSQKFKGHSDIVNAQNFKIGPTKLLSAIGGVRGSIIDTFGTGAEILRDNYDFYVLNKRGHDNDVIIEYSKNMTGLDYTEDEEGLITRIKAIAKYTAESGEETEIFTYVDSPKILDYETPFIETIDFSDKFEDEEIPTTEKLKILGEKYFKNNKCDFVKFNYKISFIPLSKCAGYEDIQDKIELCDTVGIKDYRYNLDTKAKVIKTTYDFLKERYDSMEVGEPRTTLGDVVGGGSEESKPGPPGPQGPPGADGNIGDFPNSLPSVPVLSSKLYGFSSIELSWTYENKVYYNYELYASKIKDFTPNVFDLIHAGQTSSFLFQAKPNEIWYFRVCCVNSHGNRTEFSSQVVVTTKKVDDLSNYVDNMAINDALIGTLSLDRGWIGQLRGNWIDAKNLSVTDGNGKRTLDIDSFGNVNITATNIKMIVDGEEQGIVGQSQFIQNNKEFEFKITESTSPNLV
ncbi:phage tail spike protein, partial [Romboutsia sp. 1001713B170207_170306_H8]|uniref:phage tail spike protein n=1 Tax=Romboutsia sp. 1001713B170207_170306_H8 TaxID=2787112 RepID=UPI001897B2EC